jgi:hypothetical protein
MIPYKYVKSYNEKDIAVYMDKDCNMKYVLHDNKRLYFPRYEGEYSRKFDDETIRSMYNNLIQEQDINSPHRYESQSIQVEIDDIVVDAGAAEGIFALSIIEKAKKVYLFEVANEWIDALNMTFAPWKEKVIIVNRYISDFSKNNSLALDDYFESGEINFIKADIEGGELKLLEGSKNILAKQRNLKMAICTYHHESHAEHFKKILEKNNFYIEFSKGYIVPVWDFDVLYYEKILEKINYYSEFKKGKIIPLWEYSPFFRKGIIRGIKNGRCT